MSEFEDDMGAKEDVVLAIKNKIDVDKNKLFKLTIDDLDMIFGIIYQDSNLSPSEVAEIITDNPPEQIIPAINKAMSEVEVLPEYYDEKQDIRAAILANIHEDYVGTDLKDEIRDRLLKIENIDKLVEMSQMNLKALQIALGIRPPPPTPSPTSVSEAPPTPISTAPTIPTENSSYTTPFASNSYPTTVSIPTEPIQPEPTPMEQKPTIKPPSESTPSNVVAQRQAEVRQKIEIIEKILQKAKIHPNDQLEGIEVMKRVHPDRLNRIIDIMKHAKKHDRIQILFDWFVLTQLIEEIEVLVTHWQGIQQGAGAYQAAIGMSRFDNILDEMSNRDLETFILRARKAISDVQTSQDINIRIIGVEEIKELASDLFRKYVAV